MVERIKTLMTHAQSKQLCRDYSPAIACEAILKDLSFEAASRFCYEAECKKLRAEMIEVQMKNVELHTKLAAMLNPKN
jgi:hypothetical protein